MVLLKTTYTCIRNTFLRAEIVTYTVVDNNDCGGIWEVVGTSCHRCGNEFEPDNLDEDCYCANCARRVG